MTDSALNGAAQPAVLVMAALAAVLLTHCFLAASISALSQLRGADAQADHTGRLTEVLARSGRYLEALRAATTLCTITAGWLLGTSLLPELEPSLPSGTAALGEARASETAVAATMILALALLVTFFDRVGQEIGSRWSASWVRRSASLLRLATALGAPGLIIFSAMSGLARRLFGGPVGGASSARADEEDIRRMLASAEESELSDQKREMLDNIFELSERVARQVMVPRADVVSLDINQEVSRNMQIARETGHTRFPLCDGDLDKILGFIHIKDLFRRGSPPEELLSMKREIFFVPETLPLEKLMREMRSTHVHMAPIVDEYGNVSGIVTFENVLEEIVGEIQDEFDAERPEIVRSSDGTFQVLGSMLIADLEDQLAVVLGNDEDDTIGGVVLTAIGRSPEVGDRVRVGPLDLEVVEVDVNRVRSLNLRYTEPTSLSAS